MRGLYETELTREFVTWKTEKKKGKGKGGAILALPAPPQVLAIADAASPKAPAKMFAKLKALMERSKSKVCRW